MSFDFSTTELAIAVAAGLAGAAYVFFIVVPAIRAYGRVWERIAAAFLTLYIAVTLIGIGTVAGLALVWSYDRYA